MPNTLSSLRTIQSPSCVPYARTSKSLPSTTTSVFEDSPLRTKRQKEEETLDGSRVLRVPAAPRCDRFLARRFSLQRPTPVNFRASNSNDPQEADRLDGKSLFERLFSIERKIGEGSFGEVLAVTLRGDSRPFAVKRSLRPFTSNAERLRKLREVKRHQLLPPHPNLVHLERAWEERGRLYIQLELCETSLLEYASRVHVVDEAETWSFFVDALLGLHHLHSHDLVHADVKPDNILLCARKTAKLADFGLVFDMKNVSEKREEERERQEEEKKAVDEGDSRYLAKEVLNATPTKEADVFSLGLSILEVATDLDVPPNGEGWHLIRDLCFPESLLQGMSEPLRRILLSMMDPDPSRRPSTTQLLDKDDVRNRVQGRAPLPVSKFEESSDAVALFVERPPPSASLAPCPIFRLDFSDTSSESGSNSSSPSKNISAKRNDSEWEDEKNESVETQARTPSMSPASTSPNRLTWAPKRCPVSTRIPSFRQLHISDKDPVKTRLLF